MNDRPHAAAAVRNRDAILEVLQLELRGSERVLEIGSGTGQHAVHFGAAMPEVVWQTADLEENHAGINSWIAASGLSNVLPPLRLDVSAADIPRSSFDAVFTANTAHIMNRIAVADMFALTGNVLLPGGLFALYGPFRLHGSYTSASNEDFDRMLRSRDPDMGIRDIEWLDELATAGELHRRRTYAMPSNNLLAVWQKNGN